MQANTIRSAHFPGRVYFVPSDTLIGVENAARLGIAGEQDLFGGVVPYPFVATKAITHPLVGPNAYAPEGWSDAFPHQVQDAVLAAIPSLRLSKPKLLASGYWSTAPFA